MSAYCTAMFYYSNKKNRLFEDTMYRPLYAMRARYVVYS